MRNFKRISFLLPTQQLVALGCANRNVDRWCLFQSRNLEASTNKSQFVKTTHQDLVLDVSASTGGGGRFMESYQWDLYNWSVQQDSDTPSTELQYVADASVSGGSSKLFIPGEGRASQLELTWFFNVTATNWLGGVGWTSIQVSSDMEASRASFLAREETQTTLHLRQIGSRKPGSTLDQSSRGLPIFRSEVYHRVVCASHGEKGRVNCWQTLDVRRSYAP